MAHPSLTLAFQAARPLRTAPQPSAFFRACRSLSTTHDGKPPIPAQRKPTYQHKVQKVQQQRHLSSTTPPLLATVVLSNPRHDSDGNSMLIQISDRAAKRLKQITTSPPSKNTLVPSSLASPSDAHLRVTVTSGGCHGFQYLMSLEGASKIDSEQDTIFATDSSAKEEDAGGKAVVIMDEPSLELLKGSTVDFTTELIGSQFKIVGNPRAKSSCGCGTSFDID